MFELINLIVDELAPEGLHTLSNQFTFFINKDRENHTFKLI